MRNYAELAKEGTIEALTKIEMFEYLDDLRNEGITNMYGAVPYLESDMDCDKQFARDILTEWMNTYDRYSV